MAGLGREAVRTFAEMLKHPQGLAGAIADIAQREQIELTPIGDEQVITQNVAPEAAERSIGGRYPSVYVYCEGITNLMKEKFRKFSGKIQMAAEVRVSHDRIERVTDALQYYVEALAEVLEANRGEWGPGLYYAGGYKVEFGPIKHGGKNFLQGAKVRFELEGSMG